MNPFRNILLPTDFSQHSHAALKYAAAFTREQRGRIVLFSVQAGSVPPNLVTLPERSLADPEHRWLHQLQTDVKELLSHPLLDGLEVEPIIVEGDPAQEIARAVHQFDINLVTVVTHGRKGLARALWGSTAEEIIAEASCPVLTLRPPQRDFVVYSGSSTEIRLNRVLLATNFRPAARMAEQVARTIVESTGAELQVIYVISDYMEQMSEVFPDTGGRALSQFRNYIDERMERFATESGRRPATHIAEGKPYEQIVRHASERDADLIVIGTSVHDSIFGGAPALGPEIERVVRNAPCPVLSVPVGRVVTPIPSLVTATV